MDDEHYSRDSMQVDDEELAHVDHILRSFTSYRYQHLASNNLRRQALANLPARQQSLLPSQRALLTRVDHCIVANAEFLEEVANHTRKSSAVGYGDVQNLYASKDRQKPKVTEHEMEKLRSTLRQLHRDWSAEGKEERDKAYEPIVAALDAYFANIPSEERRTKRVLVPGSGLGRLPFEIAKRGYTVQGNEFSLFMLFTLDFILNQTSRTHEHPIFPFCHTLSNVRTADDALREITVPDAHMSELPEGANMSMAAGDFTEIFDDQAGQWDCVVTCFFIDTAHNIVDYLEKIAELLAPGGIWINLGPSLWHWEGNTSGSIDIPLEEVKALARRIGFTLENEREIEMTYTSNPRGTMRYTYQSSFWTATLNR